MRIATENIRPGWATAGTIRFVILCASIVAVGMIGGRLTGHSAGVLLVVGVAAGVGGAATFVLATRRLLARLPFVSESQQVFDGVLLVLRRTGLPLLGLAFFGAWTFVYISLWWYAPTQAFTGLAANPRFADFFYYAVSTAFISPPGDILAHSRGARSATMIEMLTGLALLTAYLGSFVDWRPSRQASDQEDGG
jgi:hypothetical protein